VVGSGLQDEAVLGLHHRMKPIFLSLLATSSLFAADVASVTKQELP
jgi:hypothetical protein